MRALRGFMRECRARHCQGTRLKPESALAVTLAPAARSPSPTVCTMSISDCSDFLTLTPTEREQAAIAERVLKEINERLGFLLDVGLDTSLDRAAGHAVRWRGPAHPAGAQIGSGAGGRAGYVLDEPSIGLHQRDNRRLDKETPRGSCGPRQHGDRRRARRGHHPPVPDWVVDIGPAPASTAARRAQAPVCRPVEQQGLASAQYLSGRQASQTPDMRRVADNGVGSWWSVPASTTCATSTSLPLGF